MDNEYKKFLDEGIFKIQDGLYLESLEFLDKAVELNKNFDISYFYRAVAYHALEKYDDAILDYTKALKLNPNLTDAYYNRAKIILEKKNPTPKELNNAILDLDNALKLDENFIDALFAAAAAQKKVKNYKKALVYLERLLKIQPESVHARALKKLILQKYII